jgi:hypothetical protein
MNWYRFSSSQRARAVVTRRSLSIGDEIDFVGWSGTDLSLFSSAFSTF